jgi:hypothetical protein
MSEPEPGVPDPGARAKGEAAEMAVYFIGMVATGVALQFAQRMAGDPDFMRRIRMRVAKVVERFAATTAHEWWRLAERARLAYEAERPL